MSRRPSSAISQVAFIIGSRGQDGRLLEKLLRSKGYRLLCIEKAAICAEGVDWKNLIDITRAEDVFEAVHELQPDEIYHLAAIHHSSQEGLGEDLKLFRNAYEVNFFSLLYFLEAIRIHSKKTRLFYAASSHIFGEPPSEVQNEETPISPQSVYAMTKADGLSACRLYRKVHQVFASVGILYNHESRYREEKFLTRKVIRAVAEIKRGNQEKLVVGDLTAEVDWGYAPDYVEAMHAILAADQANEFIVATGTKHTVMEFVEAVFREAGLDWKQYVIENPQVIGRRGPSRIGDSSKLTRVTGWKPKTSFVEMVRNLLRDEMLERS